MAIPRRYHRTLLGEKSIFIHDIENKTNSRVRFPDKETASDVITVFGPESQIQIAATMLLVSSIIGSVDFGAYTVVIRITFPLKPTCLFLLKVTFLSSVHLRSSAHLLNRSNVSCRWSYPQISKGRAMVLEARHLPNAPSSSGASGATATSWSLHVRCLSSSC